MATRFEHTGNAAPTTLAADYDPADPTITIASATGWPTGAVGPFVVTVAAGTASEHKLLIASRTGAVLTVSDSSFDDTTDVAHLEGVAIIHSFSAKEADEANDLASDITALGGVPLTTTAAQTVTGKTFDVGDNTVTGTKAEFNAALSDADFATLAAVETLTNKTIDLTDNTVVGTLAELNAAVSDADLASLAGAETLTNKTLTAPTINGTVGGTPTFGAITTGALTTAAITASGNVTVNATLTADTAGGEIVLGYDGSGGLSIAQAAAPTAHPNGVVLWVSGTTLYARKPNGTDVALG